MSLLNSLKPEERSAILATRLYVEPPARTPQHIKAKMVASMKAFVEKRSLTPFEERCYQEDATRFQASRPRPQVTKRTAASVTRTAAPTIDRRHGELALRYKALNYDQIKRAVRLNYDEDTLNTLNLAEITKRSGFGFEVQAPSPRYQGQSEDPQQSLRDDDDAFDWDAEWWNRSEYDRCSAYHRAFAAKAPSLESCSDHHKCADLCDSAARTYPVFPHGEGVAARAASKKLLKG